MAARPLVQVHSVGGDKPTTRQLALPVVFQAPIRPDVVGEVYTNMAKNRRQPYAVSRLAGHQTSAESWGTGRAVARIPRVAGGGTHRAGQGAFGNMCRGGRMFAPTKTWRRWHRKISVAQRRFALVSALAASALPSLVLARGHRIEEIPEVPLVVSNSSVKDISKTKQGVSLLKALNAWADVEKVSDSKKMRSGKGKMRNRRYVKRRGPLVIYAKKTPLVQALKNISGVELCCVERLNLLQLAPGGHLGRFCIWIEDAFDRLDALYGSYTKASEKKNFKLPRAVMSNPDLNRIINSDEIQSALRPVVRLPKVRPLKKNPLKNLGVLIKLNPYAKTQRRNQLLLEEQRSKKKEEIVKAKREQRKKAKEIKKRRAAYYEALLSNPRIYEGVERVREEADFIPEEEETAPQDEDAGEE
ncbi:60S ribosomal protein L4 [Balamuthia mandrillaris]